MSNKVIAPTISYDRDKAERGRLIHFNGEIAENPPATVTNELKSAHKNKYATGGCAEEDNRSPLKQALRSTTFMLTLSSNYQIRTFNPTHT